MSAVCARSSWSRWGVMVTRQPPQEAGLATGTSAGAEQLLVIREHGAGEAAGQLRALAAHAGQLALDAAELFLERGLLAAALTLAGLEARLGIFDLDGEPLLRFHQNENFFLDLGFLLLDVLDLGEDGRVLLVGLDLVEARLGLGALGLADLEILFLGALLFLGDVQPRLGRLDSVLGFLDSGVDGGDLLWQARGVGLERGDARVQRLEIYERAELIVHCTSMLKGPSP